jgi:hypothetical protein
VYDGTPGRESVWMIVTFFIESSQIRTRAYTVRPIMRIDRVRSDGRLFVIGAAGDTIWVTPDVDVPVPFSFFAVTCTRSRNPTSADRAGYVLPVAPVIGPQFEPSASQRCHWYAKELGLPLQLPASAFRLSPTRAVPEIVGRSVFFGAAEGE